MKNVYMLFIACVCAVFVTGCVRDDLIPDQGVWFNEDLQIQISFEKEYESFAYVKDTRISCVCENDRGSAHVMLLINHLTHPNYVGNDVVFSAEVTAFDDQNLYLKDKTGTVFVFARVRE